MGLFIKATTTIKKFPMVYVKQLRTRRRHHNYLSGAFNSEVKIKWMMFLPYIHRSAGASPTCQGALTCATKNVFTSKTY